MAAWLGPAISAGASFVGGLMSQNAQKDANAATLAAQQQNQKLQKEFAQKGIRWKVEDAKQAGIHPLYALGANTVSYTPTSTSFTPETGLATGLAAAGQDVGRAINATRTTGERQDAFTKSIQAIQLESAGLDNEIKRTQLMSNIQRLKAASNPPIPTVGNFDVPQGTKAEEMPPLMVGGERITTNKNTSNMEDFEKRYGDEGPVSWLAPLAVAWQDLKATVGDASIVDILKYIDRKTQIIGRR